ncbi:MAG: hypothetical protein M1823_002410 [Watsoniomyces obsoletus]|nr:MAG: hypothetical protein M1823_002410 [Watsoniomyces obsoletus]
MAATKRKASATKGDEKTKSRKTELQEDKNQLAKKVKTSHEVGSKHEKKKTHDPSKRQTTDGETHGKNGTSVLREEEPLFPRGGGSVLTPLEHKQINLEAKRDVLFEQSGKSKAKDTTAGDDFTDDEEHSNSVVARKKKQRSKGQNVPRESAPIDVGARIEGLSFTRIVPGSLILGQISQISSDYIALALPNNLMGFVPLTAISDQLMERMAQIEAKNEHINRRQVSPEVLHLKDVFFLGSYLRVCVTSTGSVSGSARSKRRIELSVHPRLANRGLSKSDLVPNVVVQAAVMSVEDRGLVMDIGLENESVKGFMPLSELESGVELSGVQPGTVFLCLVTGQGSGGSVIKLSGNLSQAGKKTKKGVVLSDAPTIDAFLPGTAVKMSLLEVTPYGIAGRLMDQVDATADAFHSGFTERPEMSFKSGQQVTARVICNFPKSEPKKVGVSLLEHVQKLFAPAVGKWGEKKHPLDLLPFSTIVDKATVVKVVSHLGLWLDVGVEGILAFVHISKVADERIESLFSSTGPYRVGSTHQARITGYNAIDGTYIATLQPSALQQPFLRLEDAKVGQVVKGKIEKLVTKNDKISCIVIQLAEGINGMALPQHYSDVVLTHPEKIFKIGMTVKTRILSKDMEQRRLYLTLKKSLVRSDLPILDSYPDEPFETRYLGTIAHVVSTGAYVHFYGSVRGFLPLAEMSDAFIADPRDNFHDGQVVNVRVLSVNRKKMSLKRKKTQKMILSCKDTPLINSEVDEDDAPLAPLQPTKTSKSEPKKTDGKKEPQKNRENKDNKRKADSQALQTGGFDWTGTALDRLSDDDHLSVSASDEDDPQSSHPSNKKRRRKASIPIDRTGELDAHGPQSSADFERLLLGEPDSSYLWLQYMAHQLSLSEVDKARSIAERALNSISISEQAEKLHIWIGLLNLENTYGTEASLDSVFKRACQYNDPLDIHERLISIYIQSSQLEKADELFQAAIKRFSAQSQGLWLNYATFLMTTRNEPDRARALLPRATQSLPSHIHLELTSKFAQLEFRSPNGTPERGRTFFEGLFSTWPKRLDLWNVLLDLEIKLVTAGGGVHESGGGDDEGRIIVGDENENDTAKERIRGLFERVLALGLKPRKAKWFFKRWLAFEEEELRRIVDVRKDAGDGGSGKKSTKGMKGKKDGKKSDVAEKKKEDAERRIHAVKARAAQYVMERSSKTGEGE